MSKFHLTSNLVSCPHCSKRKVDPEPPHSSNLIITKLNQLVKSLFQCWCQCSPLTQTTFVYLPFGPFIERNHNHSSKPFFKPGVTLEHPTWGFLRVRHPDLLVFCQPYQFTSIEKAWKETQITTSNGCLMACKWALWSQPKPADA